MFLDSAARREADKPAYRMAGSGELVTYRELNRRTIQGANLLRALGLSTGDRVAVYMDNNPVFLEVALASIRAGCHIVPAATYLKQPELLYILEDCGAKVLVTSTKYLHTLPPDQLPRNIERVYLADGPKTNFPAWRQEIASQPEEEAQESAVLGAVMVYSSGTTGRPKGIRMALTAANSALWREPLPRTWRDEKNLVHARQDVNLITGPLYHIAPFNFACLSLKRGGTAVIMERFDAEWALLLIEQYRVTHTHMVPTMLVRLLMLPPSTRSRYDVSSLRHLEHNSAPCPIAIKDELIQWLGPVVYEIYGASEPAGGTFIDSHDWLAHKGSVGRAIRGQVHILDENHQTLSARQVGEIYFSGDGVPFEYLNSPQKWQGQSTRDGWFSYGDIGYLDEDGFLYLLDRKANLIIVGGLNVYPLEVENHLTTHPLVQDVAVLGKPDTLYGEQVHALIQLRHAEDRTETTRQELLAYCANRLPEFKCPKSIEFVASLPRTEHGKLLKRYLEPTAPST
jgi:acyl-CoA synthetase (AMP-forming)/AMP-acid ligase II